MVRLALFSSTCVVAWGNDEASLLQANTGKKRLQSASTSQWVDDFARSPGDTMMRVANMQTTEQRSLLQQFASADASSLVRELEPHRVAVALAIRRSPMPSLAKGSAHEWVSALQQHAGTIDGAISGKNKTEPVVSDMESSVVKKDPLRLKGDGSSGFETSMEAKDMQYTVIGGRCRDGLEYEDTEFDAVCNLLCEDDDACKAYETEEENGEWLCKRFSTAELALSYEDCEGACSSNENCTGFEYESSECELYETALDVEGAVPDSDNGCYIKIEEQNFTHAGERCRSGAEFEDLTQAQTCEKYCDSTEFCASSEAEEEGGIKLCKRFSATLKDLEGTTLKQCGNRCSTMADCAGFEWDDGECELHGQVNQTLSAAEELGDTHVCYVKSVPQ